MIRYQDIPPQVMQAVARVLADNCDQCDDTSNHLGDAYECLVACMAAWPGAERLSATEIHISGHPVAIQARINLPLPVTSTQ